MIKFAVVSTCYKNPPEWKKRHCDSVDAQRAHVELTHHYIDAAEQDVPLDSISNVFNVVSKLPPETVVAWLDGDDWFAHPMTLDVVEDVYIETHAWLTWGQFRYSTGDIGWAYDYTAKEHRDAAYRKLPWRTTHLKTFRAGLFQQIPGECLLDQATLVVDSPTALISILPFTRCCDLAVMFPMLEMCPPEFARFIPFVLSAYNFENPLSQHNASGAIDAECKRQEVAIRAMRPLKRLGQRPW